MTLEACKESTVTVYLMFLMLRITTMMTVIKDIDGEKHVFTAVKAAFVGAKIVSPAVVVTAVAKPALQTMHT
jgi:hypothetical protein